MYYNEFIVCLACGCNVCDPPENIDCIGQIAALCDNCADRHILRVELRNTASQPVVQADADLLPCGHSKKYIVYGHKRVYCSVCDRPA